MIIVTVPGITDSALARLVEHVEAAGLRTHVSRGEHRTIVGCIGDEGVLSEHGLTQLEGVERVGYRAITICGTRDPVLIGQIDGYLATHRDKVAAKAVAASQ